MFSVLYTHAGFEKVFSKKCRAEYFNDFSCRRIWGRKNWIHQIHPQLSLLKLRTGTQGSKRTNKIPNYILSKFLIIECWQLGEEDSECQPHLGGFRQCQDNQEQQQLQVYSNASTALTTGSKQVNSTAMPGQPGTTTAPGIQQCQHARNNSNNR